METRLHLRGVLAFVAVAVAACGGTGGTVQAPSVSPTRSPAVPTMSPTLAPNPSPPVAASPDAGTVLQTGLPPSRFVLVSTRSADGQWALSVLDRAGERTPVPFTAASMGEVAARPGTSEVALVATLCEAADQPCGTIIVAVDLSTGATRHLTPYAPTASDGWPTWSPDGSRLAFSSSRAGNPSGQELYLTTGDGGDPVRLETGLVVSQAPAWSPDGSAIAFVGMNADMQSSIYLVPATGGPARPLVPVDGTTPLSWSPDGARLAYQGSNVVQVAPDTLAGYASIEIVRVSDGTTTVLRATPSMNRAPAWSPDGATIAFIAEGESPTTQLAVIGLDGQDGRLVGDSAWDDRFFAWLP